MRKGAPFKAHELFKPKALKTPHLGAPTLRMPTFGLASIDTKRLSFGQIPGLKGALLSSLYETVNLTLSWVLGPMGRWRNRLPRRKYDPHRYLYQESAHRFYTDPSTPDNVPSWEKRFCRLVGTIPWAKIVYSKTLLNYHDNICHWDDSAAEEAFQNAKKRFWAEINGLPCDISPPDPDTYIDKINWNQAIDPELIKDLDKQYFNPEDVEEVEEMGSKKKRIGNLVGSPSDRCDVNLKNSVNPWEINILHRGKEVKKVAWSTNSWDNETREPGRLHSDDNPWEQSNSCHWVRKENEWADGVNLSGWNQWGGDSNQQNCGNSENNEKWAKTALNSSHWNAEKSTKFGSNPDAMGYGYIREDRASKDVRWRKNVATTSRGWKHWDDHKYEQKSSRRTWVPRDGEGSRKRGSSHQHTSRYRSSGFRGDDKQASQ